MRTAALAGVALAAGIWSSGGRGQEADADLFESVNRDHGASADRFFVGITELGSIWASVGAAAALAAIGHRREAARGLAAAGVAWLAGQGLKKVILRPRPYTVDPEGVRLMIGPPKATSWPSSHPAVLFAFVTVAGSELRLPRSARAALAGLTAAVGASRTYVGVHYPSDVAGGLLIGRAIGNAFSRSGGMGGR
jgi:membrane-associated phospholipid phosphatase